MVPSRATSSHSKSTTCPVPHGRTTENSLGHPGSSERTPPPRSAINAQQTSLMVREKTKTHTQKTKTKNDAILILFVSFSRDVEMTKGTARCDPFIFPVLLSLHRFRPGTNPKAGHCFQQKGDAALAWRCDRSFVRGRRCRRLKNFPVRLGGNGNLAFDAWTRRFEELDGFGRARVIR